MLLPESEDKSDGFVLSGQRGRWAAENQVLYYSLKYDETAYCDESYSLYGVPFPQNLERGARKRRAEYLAGRICCSRILDYAGIEGKVGTDSKSRAPVWPAEINGSISHCRGYAIAVICPRDWGYLGVDMEFLDSPLLMESAGTIMPDKKSRSPWEVLVNFSAKESLFKALYPQLGIYFGFEYADVIINEASQEFSISLNRRLAPPTFDTHRSWVGTYKFDACTHIITTLVADPTEKSIGEGGC